MKTVEEQPADVKLSENGSSNADKPAPESLERPTDGATGAEASASEGSSRSGPEVSHAPGAKVVRRITEPKRRWTVNED